MDPILTHIQDAHNRTVDYLRGLRWIIVGLLFWCFALTLLSLYILLYR